MTMDSHWLLDNMWTNQVADSQLVDNLQVYITDNFVHGLYTITKLSANCKDIHV